MPSSLHSESLSDMTVPEHENNGTHTEGDSPDVSPAGLINVLESQFSVQSKLCDFLEEIADSLPANVDVRLCQQVARSLYPTIKKAHSFEEDVLFPMLEAAVVDAPALTDSIGRLKDEHWEDESYAEEISSVLIDLGMGRTNHDPEKTGYMLRGFFGGLKRHIAFEKEYLVPILKQIETH